MNSRLTEECHGLDAWNAQCFNGDMQVPVGLFKTPYPRITEPEGGSDVTGRIHSEEEIINDNKILLDLYILRDSVYRPRDDPFHRDLEHFVEYSKRGQAGILRTEATNGQVDGNGGREFSVVENRNDSTDGVNSTPTSNYSYDRSSFVAMQTNLDEGEAMILIGKFLESTRSSAGLLASVAVHLFERKQRKDPLFSKYGRLHKIGLNRKLGPP